MSRTEFAITAIHQVELTSHCNLRCRYCPSPHLGREKLHMPNSTFDSVLHWAKYFVDNGTQTELNLAGIGESTMHPEFVEFVAKARAVLGTHVMLTLATNGLLVTEQMAKDLAPLRPLIWVSMHRPEKAGPAIEILKRHKLLSGVSADPSVSAIDWAGQVNWFVSAPRRKCQWVRSGKVFVMADGRVSRCCLDADARGVFAHIDRDDFTKLATSPYSLCETCDQDVGVPLVAQEVGSA